MTRDEFIPDRVQVTPSYALPPGETDIKPTIIFVRDDGWSLGTTSHLEGSARLTWKDRWKERWVLQVGTGEWLRMWPLPVKREITEDERTCITNGLLVAAKYFEDHAVELRKPPTAPHEERLAKQFGRQAAESKKLAERIEGAEKIEITEDPV